MSAARSGMGTNGRANVGHVVKAPRRTIETSEMRIFAPLSTWSFREQADAQQRPTFGHGTLHGLASQTSVAYSEIVRSLENRPELAMFAMTLRVQRSGSAYSLIKRASASR
jgi:hypothetical protein